MAYFRLYPTEHLLLRDGTALPLAPKAFDILVFLVQNSGHLVKRDALMEAIWPDSFVEETNITVNVSLLRKTLGTMGDGQPYIETVPRKGYRFNASVIEAEDLQPPVSSAEQPRLQESSEQAAAAATAAAVSDASIAPAPEPDVPQASVEVVELPSEKRPFAPLQPRSGKDASHSRLEGVGGTSAVDDTGDGCDSARSVFCLVTLACAPETR